jgi:hypothetical protein
MQGAISEGRSPAIEKQREKRRLKEAKSFGEFGEKWLVNAPMADSTRAMRRSIFERELLPVWRNRLLTEITPDDLRAHCGKIVDRGAPATAIHYATSSSKFTGSPSCTARRSQTRPTMSGRPYCDVRAEGSLIISHRDPDDAQAARESRDPTDDPAGDETVSTDDGPQERAAGCSLGRGGFRERRLDDPQGADEAIKRRTTSISRARPSTS